VTAPGRPLSDPHVGGAAGGGRHQISRADSQQIHTRRFTHGPRSVTGPRVSHVTSAAAETGPPFGVTVVTFWWCDG